MLSFAAITPHPPIMIPNVGGDNTNKISRTIKAMEKLSDLMTDQNLDSLIIISPHGQLLSEKFTVNLSSDFKADFKKFGDFVTEIDFRGDVVLAQKIKEATESVTYVSSNQLDHGISVPLFYLLKKDKEMPIVPVGFSSLSLQDHFDFGKILQKVINQTDKKIGVIASGDLSHCLTKDAPGGFSQEGNIFDEKLIEFIKEKDIENILKLDPKLVEQAGECGLRSILILLGLLDDQEYKPEVLSYEAPFGVGYFVANFE